LRQTELPADRLVFFGVHFLFILLISFADVFSVFSRSSTFFPATLNPFWDRAAEISLVPLGQTLPATNPIHETVSAYLNIAGIEAGYSYFAPNIPDNYKIVFELHYPDGRTEFELPEVKSRAAGLRLGALLDEMAELEYEPLRAMMVKMLAYSVWQEHPEVRKIRAVLGYVDLPTPAEFRLGRKESYHVLFAYDFDFSAAQPSHP
jgi:hypothetical protein